jgi:hypothetical protein
MVRYTTQRVEDGFPESTFLKEQIDSTEKKFAVSRLKETAERTTKGFYQATCERSGLAKTPAPQFWNKLVSDF